MATHCCTQCITINMTMCITEPEKNIYAKLKTPMFCSWVPHPAKEHTTTQPLLIMHAHVYIMKCLDTYA